jgi:hypothetical protein
LVAPAGEAWRDLISSLAAYRDLAKRQAYRAKLAAVYQRTGLPVEVGALEEGAAPRGHWPVEQRGARVERAGALLVDGASFGQHVRVAAA